MIITEKKLGRQFFMVFCFFFLSIIEMFYVIAPLTESYTPMIILQLFSLISLGLCWIIKKSGKIQFDMFILLMLLFLSDMTISAFFSGTSRFSVDMIFYWSSFLMIILCFNIKKYKIEDFIFKFLAFYGIFFAVGVFLQMMFTDVFERNYFSLFKGEYKTSVYRQVIYHQMYTGWASQTFAVCMNFVAAIFSSWILWEKKHNKIWLVIMIINAVAMLLTGKRGPVVFMLFSILFVNLILTKKFNDMIKKIWRYVILAVVVGVAILIYISSEVNTSRNTIVRFMEMFNGSNDDVSNGRFILWKLAVEIFIQNPVFGIGWRAYPVHAIPYEGIEMYTHNVYLQILSEQGIVGIVLYLAFILYAMIDTYRMIKRKDNIFSGEGVYLLKFSLMLQCFLFLYSLTGNVLYDYNAVLLYFFAFMLYMYVKNTNCITGEELYEKICNVYAWRK